MEVVTIQFLTNRYDVTKQSLGEWVLKCPSMKIGHNQYDLSACDLFVINTLKKDLEKSKDRQSDGRLYLAQCRKIEADATLKEIEIKEKEGLLMPVAETIGVITTNNTAIRNSFLAMPHRISLELSSMGDKPGEICAFLEEIVREYLENLNSVFERELDTIDNNNNILDE